MIRESNNKELIIAERKIYDLNSQNSTLHTKINDLKLELKSASKSLVEYVDKQDSDTKKLRKEVVYMQRKLKLGKEEMERVKNEFENDIRQLEKDVKGRDLEIKAQLSEIGNLKKEKRERNDSYKKKINLTCAEKEKVSTELVDLKKQVKYNTEHIVALSIPKNPISKNQISRDTHYTSYTNQAPTLSSNLTFDKENSSLQSNSNERQNRSVYHSHSKSKYDEIINKEQKKNKDLLQEIRKLKKYNDMIFK
mmetsp:Transcript_24305/g.21570  ORF Transcript_24305/g.21570 Transcript_24305/m.21570 type:complete len:251 (+) Transcript_24305:546-1298(+)